MDGKNRRPYGVLVIFQEDILVYNTLNEVHNTDFRLLRLLLKRLQSYLHIERTEIYKQVSSSDDLHYIKNIYDVVDRTN